MDWLAQTVPVAEPLTVAVWAAVALGAVKVAFDAVTKLRNGRNGTESQSAPPCRKHGEDIVRLQEQYRQLVEGLERIERKLGELEKLIRGD